MIQFRMHKPPRVYGAKRWLPDPANSADVEHAKAECIAACREALRVRGLSEPAWGPFAEVLREPHRAATLICATVGAWTPDYEGIRIARGLEKARKRTTERGK